jgi:hypothetical protein
MKRPRRRWLIALSVFGAVLVLSVGGWRIANVPPRPLVVLQLRRAGATNLPAPALGSVVSDGSPVPDGLRRKYAPARRGEFLLVSAEDTSIFVLATGIQMLTSSGWQTESEDTRSEIWRLKAGRPVEVCVERPDSGTWRAFVRYGFEMHGTPLLKAQVREAWILRSVSNWTGQAWGGDRFHGSVELFSAELEE